MIRKIININEEKCNGCGLCAKACHEGAIRMINGKAKLIRDDYCDGLGDCLPVCPTGAITFCEREAAPYDEEAVKANKNSACGCPGSKPMTLPPSIEAREQFSPSMLRQWPVQIKLAPVNAPYFDNAELLIAADCTAYAYGSFHSEFMKNKITLIGCPKLDSTDYSEKLKEILMLNDIRKITVARMEVPCCGGIENAVRTAISECGKEIPLNVVTITTDGRIK